jgi:hypothetical protein
MILRYRLSFPFIPFWACFRTCARALSSSAEHVSTFAKAWSMVAASSSRFSWKCSFLAFSLAASIAFASPIADLTLATASLRCSRGQFTVSIDAIVVQSVWRNALLRGETSAMQSCSAEALTFASWRLFTVRLAAMAGVLVDSLGFALPSRPYSPRPTKYDHFFP